MEAWSQLVHSAIHMKPIHAAVMRLYLGWCMGASAFVAMLMLKTGNKKRWLQDYSKNWGRLNLWSGQWGGQARSGEEVQMLKLFNPASCLSVGTCQSVLLPLPLHSCSGADSQQSMPSADLAARRFLSLPCKQGPRLALCSLHKTQRGHIPRVV